MAEQDREFWKRLEALNGGPLRYRNAATPAQPAPATPPPSPPPVAPICYRRNLPRLATSTPPPAPRRGGRVVLEEAIEGYEVDVASFGTAYLIETALSELPGEWHQLSTSFAEELADATSCVRQRLAARCKLELNGPEDVVLIDLETTGLGMSQVFLIGTVVWEGGDLVVRQYLARHYAEEAAITAHFLDRTADKRLLVSFNGKSFDYPQLRARAAANAIPFALELAHLDMLHECRRVWKHTLPNCRLQTLERHICGRSRHGDIPGYEIPNAYHSFVHTTDAFQLVQIIKHNMLDLVTLAELMVLLPEGG